MTTVVRIKLDSATKRWFDKRHFGTETTVTKCTACGIFYKPELGHKCSVAVVRMTETEMMGMAARRARE